MSTEHKNTMTLTLMMRDFMEKHPDQKPQIKNGFSSHFVWHLAEHIESIEQPGKPDFWKRANVRIGWPLFLIGFLVQFGLGIFADAAMHERVMKSLMFFGQNSMTLLMVAGALLVVGPKLKEMGILKRFTGGS